MSAEIYTQDVTDILDLFFENDANEPDWAAIKTRLFAVTDSQYSLTVNLLRAFWAVYEDPASFATIMWRLENERTE